MTRKSRKLAPQLYTLQGYCERDPVLRGVFVDAQRVPGREKIKVGVSTEAGKSA